MEELTAVQQRSANLRAEGLDLDKVSKPLSDDEKAELVLERGGAIDILVEAVSEEVAGEKDLIKLLIYSAFSSCLPGKIHIYLMGDSQQGKSFIGKKILDILFTGHFMTASSMSSKAPYYMVESEGPCCFKGKVLLADEMADLSEDTRAMIKQMTSNNQERMEHMTVDEKKHFKKFVIEGMPVIWGTSMELFEDVGSQIANRFWKANVDETIEQSKRIIELQKRKIMLGHLERKETKKDLARTMIERIVTDERFEIINPFIDCYELDEKGPRNRLPMYHHLVSAITFSNRYARKCLNVNEDRFVLSSLKDNKEALRLWKAFNRPQATALPDRYLRILDCMEEDVCYKIEDLTSRFNKLAAGKGQKKLSTGTVRNYLKDLSERNLVTAEHGIEEYEGREREARFLVYTKFTDIFTTSSQFDFVKDNFKFIEKLDNALRVVKDSASQLHAEAIELDVTRLRDELLQS
jgi:hypothetical protein